MTQTMLLMIIAISTTVGAGILFIGFLQKLGFNVYSKLKQALNPDLRKHKKQVKAQQRLQKAKKLAEELNK